MNTILEYQKDTMDLIGRSILEPCDVTRDLEDTKKSELISELYENGFDRREIGKWSIQELETVFDDVIGH